MISGLTDKGLIREINEDSFWFSEDGDNAVIVVADGMGGHNAGNVASEFAVSAVKEIAENHNMYEDSEKKIRLGIISANEKIFMHSCSNKNMRGMGTTMVTAIISDNKAIVGNVGDSRAYLADKESIIQITDDHSYVNELLKNGMITEEEARIHPKKNEILKAVGIGKEVYPDIFEVNLKKGVMILVCTDGLTNMITDTEIHRILNSSDNTEEILKTLIDTANQNGGTDNITAVLLKR